MEYTDLFFMERDISRPIEKFEGAHIGYLVFKLQCPFTICRFRTYYRAISNKIENYLWVSYLN